MFGGLTPSIGFSGYYKSTRHHGGAKRRIQYAKFGEGEKGFANLKKHIENCKKFGLNPVVAINAFLLTVMRREIL